MSLHIERLGLSVRGLANWILDYADEIGRSHTNMGLNKLVFFALEALLVEKGVLITNAKIEAWEHGPVFRELYQSFKQFGNGYVTGRARNFSADTGDFEEARVGLATGDARFLRAALAPLISCTAAELRALSHRPGGAWHQVWWYEGHANPGMEISPALLIATYKRTQP